MHTASLYQDINFLYNYPSPYPLTVTNFTNPHSSHFLNQLEFSPVEKIDLIIE